MRKEERRIILAKIRELSTLLADQIAAGEVVERPASVIKELVENAIDANSTQIDVVIEEAGLKKIQVVDNGDGMDETDALVAFKRHATSKIYNKEDLFRIKTLGFRGEALPSIASVSHVTLETAQEQGVGTCVVMKAGEVIEKRATRARKGTSMTVENLFFNTPARLKFIRSLQREVSQIADLMNRLALSYPMIAFSLTSDGNTLLKTTGNGQLQQTIANIYTPSLARQMKPFQASTLDFSISGFTSLPELTRSTKQYISIFLNGRYIKNYALSQAIIDGYGSKLMVGRFPVAVLMIETDVSLVDVNVHPTKQQVRISQEQDLGRLVSETIQALWQDTLRIPSSLPKRLREPIEQTELVVNMTQEQPSLLFEEPIIPVERPIEKSLEPVKSAETQTVVQEEAPVYVAPKPAFPELHYFGQMHGTYLFAENTDGLYIVDQHAAQERIKYEYYRVAIGEMGQEAQGLLVPIVLDYPMNEYMLIKEKQHVLSTIGIMLQPFGQTSFLLEEHPAWMKENVEEVVRELIDILLESGNVSIEKFREDTAIMMSCKKSIKANHYLDDAQARALLAELSGCENPYNCPHGRPVLVHVSQTDLEKMFKRIQDK